IGDVVQLSLFHLLGKLLEKHVLLHRVIKELLGIFNSFTQQLGKLFLSVGVVLQILFNHPGNPGFDDVGFVTGLFVSPVFFLLLSHLANIVSARRFTHFNPNNVFIQQFLHLLGIGVVIHPLTGILFYQLAQVGHLLNGFLVVATISIGETFVFKEGG